MLIYNGNRNDKNIKKVRQTLCIHMTMVTDTRTTFKQENW
jgi:hypothetical protein